MAQPNLTLRTTRNGLFSHYVVAGSKNPPPLGVGSVKTIKKWGNSQGILINKSILASTNMIIGDQVSIITDDKDKIIIQKTPAKQTLEDLFNGYTGTYECEEISLDSVGKEF